MRRSIAPLLLGPALLASVLPAAASGSPVAAVRAHLGSLSFQRPAGWSVFPYGRLQTQFVIFLGCIGSDPNPDTCGNAPPAMRRGSIMILVSASGFLLPPGQMPDLGPGQPFRVDGHPARLHVLGKPKPGDACAAREATVEMTAIIGDLGKPPADSSTDLTACIRAPAVGVRMQQFETLVRSIRLSSA